ncbi:hypothetical protein VII00023_16160 [Vibrio ichthyoenteri ATCC 700023]|uniref:BatD n=1 Tax=Vibrio ichthyoenteri ATCC 700023 TaxID=870968 RepID=F9S0B2_9VIBR|nr:BatD family protein [Vibrio ichthyoenteri]EGU43382.1 hypothetical protein VII00023_16160 [Vibrio ichthyoenteri ATCC 700023]
MMNINPFNSMRLLALALLVTVSAHIQGVQASVDPSLVKVKAWVGDTLPNDKPGNQQTERTMERFAVNQQIILYIDVSTPRWFAAGTRIAPVEVPGVIAKQRNQLATNYTQREQGETWSHQRWETTLYPQQSGLFTISPLAVAVKVSLAGGGSASGTIYTPSITFEARLPSGLLSDDTPWFSATSVDVQQEWALTGVDGVGDTLHVGDAITRTITINASDTLSVLIPDLLVNELSDDYQSYPQPNRLDDSHARGDYRSSRTEQSVYVIQQGGAITLPEYTFQWWNSEKNQVETVTLASKTFHAKHTFVSFTKAYASSILLIVSLILLLIVVIYMLRRYYQNHPAPLWLDFARLLKRREWGKARAMIYRQLRIERSQLELNKLDSSEDWSSTMEAFQHGKQEKALFKRIWRAVRLRRQPLLSLPKALPALDDSAINLNQPNKTKNKGNNPNHHKG